MKTPDGGGRRAGRAATAVSRLATDEDRLGLLALFERIAHEQGWRPGDALGAHCDRSAYFAARVGGLLAGGLQLVLPRAGLPLPCRAVWPEAGVAGEPDALDGVGTAEVLILALLPQCRGRHGLLWPLCVAMWRLCVAEGVTSLLLEATPPTLAVYRRLGFPLEVVGGLREHWGEDCYLCRMGVREVAEALAAKAARSRTYREVLALARPDVTPPG